MDLADHADKFKFLIRDHGPQITTAFDAVSAPPACAGGPGAVPGTRVRPDHHGRDRRSGRCQRAHVLPALPGQARGALRRRGRPARRTDAGRGRCADSLAPLEILLCAFRVAGRILEDNRPFSEPRLEVIAATPALRERELAKAASLTEAVAEALRQRCVADRLARLAAQTGWATFHEAAQAWIDDPSQSLDAHLFQAFEDLRYLSATAFQTKTRSES